MDYGYVDAIYKEGKIPEYRGNPLIECLPPIMDYEQAANILSYYPPICDEEKDDPTEIRFHYLQRVFDLFQPLSKHLGLLNQFGRLINQGYKGRNPLDKSTTEFLNQNYERIMSGEPPINEEHKGVRKVQGFSLIGVSGIGKSTAIERILDFYPQVIRHTTYNDKPLVITQIPWIKIECPGDGSTKTLCLNFFKKVDELIGTEYFNRWGKNTEGRMVTQMAHLSRLYNIGVIIIDEIQHLMIQKVGGVKKMLNFFVTLVNSIGVPVILIGTNKAFDILGTEMRQARRNTGQGNIITSKWTRIEQNTIDWEIIAKRLFRYQWTKKRVELSDELKEVLYEESQGIIDITVKLFVLVQMIAMMEGSEKITPSLIKRTANEHLSSLRPMLEALKSGKSSDLDRFEDLKTSLAEKLVDMKERLELDNSVREEAEKSKEYRKELQKLLEKKLTEVTTDTKIVKKAANNVLKKYTITKDTTLEFLFDHAVGYVESNINKTKNKKSSITFAEDDLRGYKNKAQKEKCSVHQLLKDDKVIKSLYKFNFGEV